MDDMQKEEIIKMRLEGAGYKTIAKELDLSIDSVKGFCERNYLKGSNEVVKLNYKIALGKNILCACCSKKIRKNIMGRTRKFCSDYCRRKWWNENRDKRKMNKSAIYKFTCPKCGRKFQSYGNKKRKYCSHECYIASRFYEGERNGIKSSETG